MLRQLTDRETTPKVVVYSPYPETHACAYIRIAAPMRAAGFDVIWARHTPTGPFDVNIARTAHFIVIHRQFPSVRTEKVLSRLLGLGIPIIYDLDDMLLDVPASHPSCVELRRRAPYIKWALAKADLITVSTTQLRSSLQKHTSRPMSVQPNLVDWTLFAARPRPRAQEFRFVISGTSTHGSDWGVLEEPLENILARHPGVAKILFLGEVPKRLAGHQGVECIAFENDYGRYASRLKMLDVHAALVPLEDNEFNRCKSNIKWLEYTAAGVPGAYSDLTPYRSSISHRESGLLVSNTGACWFDAMNFLMSDIGATSLMIENSRRSVFENYSIENAVDLYLAPYSALLGQKHKRRLFSGFETYGSRLAARARHAVSRSRFAQEHIMWRLNRR